MTNNDDLFNSRLWILKLLPEKLPGKVIKTWGKGHCRIRCLIDGLPLSDGSHVTSFIGFGHDVKPIDNNRSSLEIEDHVLFTWDAPGERSKDKNGDKGDPKAIEIEVINVEDAEKIASEIRDITEIIHLRKRLIELNKFAKQNIQEESKKIQEEWEELKQAYENLENDFLFYNLDQINESLKEIQEQYQKIEEIKALQNKQQEDLDKQDKQLEPYRSLLPKSEEDEEIYNIQLVDLPENFGHKWKEQLENNGLYVTKQIANSYLISIFSALYLGRLVLLNGTVGVGKTSIIKHSATLLGGKDKIIPVRPAWLDPSDLLGFYDPLQEIFRPAPFLDALNEASKYERHNKNRLHLVCLDELNLAKIENYASDVLSQLEYSQQSKEDGLTLYSKNIWENLKEECEHLQQQEDVKSKQRLKIIQNLLDDYPKHTFSIPRNLVLLGTLNSDETTYDLSPKLIDRSFIITYPAVELPQDLPSSFNLKTKTHESQNSSYYSIVEKVKDLQIDLSNSAIQKYWNLINLWNNNYLRKGLGIPLGYRIFEDYKIFLSVGTYLGFSHEESFGYFIFAKILPRIKFFKDEENRKVTLLQKWMEELKPYKNYDPANILEKLGFQINQEQEQYISYWNSSIIELSTSIPDFEDDSDNLLDSIPF